MTGKAGNGSVARDGQPLGRMLLVQLAAYLVMVALVLAGCLTDVPAMLVAVAALAMVVAYVVCWPFASLEPSGMVVERVATLVFGLVSIGVATLTDSTQGVRGFESEQGLARISGTLLERWAFAFVILLVVLIVFGFAAQMARERRVLLVRSLSSAILSGVAAICLGGWPVTARFWRALRDAGFGVRTLPLVLAVVVIAMLVVALALISWRWWREYAADAPTRSWVGFGVLPVMMAGLLPMLASVVLLL